MNKYCKNELEHLILIEKKPYEVIGRDFGVSGSAIKKAAKKLGINLPKRRNTNTIETFNKNRIRKIKNCLNCNTEIPLRNKYCSNKCHREHQSLTKSKICQKHGCEKRKYGDNRLKCPKCVSESVSNRRRKLKIMAVEYKGGKCEKCGYNKCIAALEFHHKDTKEKDFSISQSGTTRSWKKIKIELDKCILVCSNCHKEIHNS